jgi:LPS sulfotransferase NodH
MANIPISEKNRRELSRERDFPVVTPVAKRYAILSSPRSGSTLLGRALYETKLAGDPQEYFNPPLLALEREQTGNANLNLNAFMRGMQERRTSSNGVFGMKMHYSQLLRVFRARTPNPNLIGYLRKFDKLVWMRRRDRIRQAISQAVGMRTNVWSSEDSRFERDPQVNVHPYECIRALNAVCHEDAGWEQLVQHAKLEVHEVWYEDLVSDYEPQLRRVLRHLGIEDSVAEIPQQPIERQSGPLNERLRTGLLAYVGLSDHV